MDYKNLIECKQISKEICEECGIKPVYGVWVDNGDWDYLPELICNKRKYRLIADIRNEYPTVDDKILRDLKPEYTLNFAEPHNFVDIFSLFSRHLDLQIPCSDNPVKSVLSAILEYLKSDNPSVKIIKEEIHYIDWEDYELIDPDNSKT